MRFLLLSFLILHSAVLQAQDERFFRKLFSGELRSREEKQKPDDLKFQVAGKQYRLDMNGDGRVESFVSEKRNGIEWLNIHNYKGEIIYRTSLETKGLNSWLYKISMRRISPQTKVFILYFYEGAVEYLEYRAQAHVYFLTMDDNKLDSLKINKGAAIFDEYESFKKHYHARPYKLELIDLNKDGVKEILVKYHLNQWVYIYEYPGKWHEI